MRLQLEPATAEDAPALARLQTAVAEDLTARFGKGPWSAKVSERGVLFHLRNNRVYVVRRRGEPVATLTLCTKKPWAIDRGYFTPCKRPLYLLNMAVAPAAQRTGIGRLCMEEVRRIGLAWPGDAICLDAFDAEAGAGAFYRKCGLRETGRVTYRDVPLIYFEMLLHDEAGTPSGPVEPGRKEDEEERRKR